MDVIRLLSCEKPGARVLLGCTGSVASIKVPLIARKLQDSDVSVIVVPSRQALHFLRVTAMTSSTGNSREVYELKVKNDQSLEKMQLPIYCLSCALARTAAQRSDHCFLGNLSRKLSTHTVCSTVTPAQSCFEQTLKTSDEITDTCSVPVEATETCTIPDEGTEASTATCEIAKTSTATDEATNTYQASSCEWCAVQYLYPDLVIAGDTLEWELWQERGDAVLHIELRRWAHVFVIAPLSANTLAKLVRQNSIHTF